MNILQKIKGALKQVKLRLFPTKAPLKTSSEMHLQITQEGQKNIQILMDRTEQRSFTLLIRRALATYDIVSDHVAQGGIVILKSPDGTSRVFDPISFTMEHEPDEEG